MDYKQTDPLNLGQMPRKWLYKAAYAPNQRVWAHTYLSQDSSTLKLLIGSKWSQLMINSNFLNARNLVQMTWK
jgi:hypothetical protein